MSKKAKPLVGYRVLAVLNGLELFGHERGNIEVFKVLREMGADVIVGVNVVENGGRVAEYLRNIGFVTFALPFSNHWSRQWLKQHPWSIFEKLKAVIACNWIFHKKLRKFRATHVHLGSPLAYSYLSLALGLSDVPLIYRLGDCPPVDSDFNMRIWQMAMKRANRVVANSEYVRKEALQAGARDVSIIYNVAPSRAEAGRSSVGEARDDSIRIVYVGSVAEHKGLVPLFVAFCRLSQDLPMLRLDIVGGSRYDAAFRCRLREMVSSNHLDAKVRLFGYVDDPSGLYERAALHVAPSIWEEPLGNVVLEAKRVGTPSVVFPSGGLPEMVRHGVDGHICVEKSCDALEAGLRWMLADLDRLTKMGAAAKEDSERRFGRDRFVTQWSDIYESISSDS
jgi:glycosyltransferase involved in cell wall biosynthesis